MSDEITRGFFMANDNTPDLGTSLFNMLTAMGRAQAEIYKGQPPLHILSPERRRELQRESINACLDVIDRQTPFVMATIKRTGERR